MNIILSESLSGIDFLGSKDLNIERFDLETETTNSDTEVFVFGSYQEAAVLLEVLNAQKTAFKQTGVVTSGFQFAIDPIRDFDHLEFHCAVGVQEIYADAVLWDSKPLRLGHIKENIFFAEPSLRDAEILLFDLNALKKSEAPAKEDSSPLGLTAEEACNLIYFAGNGSCEKLVFYNLDHNRNISDIQTTEELIFHLTYYFEKGREKRSSANLEKTEYIQEYHVQLDDMEEPIAFRMNQLSNKWWIIIPQEDAEERRIPCRPEDYLKAKEGEISPNLLDLLV